MMFKTEASEASLSLSFALSDARTHTRFLWTLYNIAPEDAKIDACASERELWTIK